MSTRGSEPPLVVDLDGSLLRSDTLLESLARLLRRSPHRMLAVPFWLASGRAHLKARLAQAAGGISPESLPYREDIVAWLREERGQGRRIVLATAANTDIAASVAAHLGIFDEVIASSPEHNLKGEQKRQALVARFGERGFDYAGNGPADLPAWRSARRAYVLDGPADLAQRAGTEATELRLANRKPAWLAFLGALRLHHWSKNALVFVPLLTAHKFFDAASQRDALLAFLAFSLAASGAYLLNDLADLESDRQDASKRRRPFACGDLPLAWGFLAAPLLLVAAALLAARLGDTFLLVIAAYLVASSAYTVALKRVPILDVIVLAGLYTLRIIGGAVAIDVVLSHWLLGFSMFVFLSLALAKRHAELTRLAGTSASGRGYRGEDLQAVAIIGLSSAMVSLVILSLYISSRDVLALYRSPAWLWLVVPVLLYWLARVWLVTLRRELHEDPLVFAFHDGPSYLIAFLCLAAVAAAI